MKRKVCSIVFTQLTKWMMWTVARGREHVADFHRAVGDHHAIDEQFHQGPALVEGGRGQAVAHLVAEGLDAGCHGAELAPLVRDGLELPLLCGERVLAPTQLLLFLLEGRQLHHPGDVRVEYALLLPRQLGHGLAERRLARLQLLREPVPALRPGER